jgi:hypothetical protein
MASGTWVTTAAEDAAITELTGETPEVFIERHIRHQASFAVSKQQQIRETRKAAAVLPANVRDQVASLKEQIDALIEPHIQTRPRVRP